MLEPVSLYFETKVVLKTPPYSANLNGYVRQQTNGGWRTCLNCSSVQSLEGDREKEEMRGKKSVELEDWSMEGGEAG